MKTDFITRESQQGDLDSVAALLREHYFKSAVPSGDEAEEEIVQNRARELIDAGRERRGRLFLAEADGKPVAMAYVVCDERRGGLLVDELYTRKAFEGNGIASALLKDCERFAKQEDSDDLHLSVVAAKKPLVDFYEKRGWLKRTFGGAGDGETTDIDPLNTRVETHVLCKQPPPSL